MSDSSSNLTRELSPAAIDALKSSLLRHQRNLALLNAQRAKFGIDVPLHIINQIEEQEAIITKIETSLANYTKGELSLADQHFSRGTRALIAGDLWEARRYYEMTLQENPYYPRAEQQLDFVKRGLDQSLPKSLPPILSRRPRYSWVHDLIIIAVSWVILGTIVGVIVRFFVESVAISTFAIFGGIVGVLLAIIFALLQRFR